MQAPTPSEVRIVLITAPITEDDVAGRIARVLVDARLAACVNIVPRVRSIYRWEGKIADDAEAMLVVKTTTTRLDELIERASAEHPYDCPEVIAVPVGAGLEGYLSWVASETTPGDDTDAATS